MKLGQAIGEQLEQLRVNRGLTRREVAERVGMSPRVLERVETGFHPNAQWNTICGILKGLGVSLYATYERPDNEDSKDSADVA